ncbi:MAG: carbamoyltransferase HypF [Gammaproteobacteria bacterium]|nr:carbamoyltransferase HypF [Gammaproteobacteria bacterium]
MAGEEILVSGVVQGVGFRPTVWRLALECGITGRVWNDAAGVTIQAWGSQVALDEFVARIESEQPALARIEEMVRSALSAVENTPDEFQIGQSRGGEVRSGVTADAATCHECMCEVLDPGDRRYRYPFTNCTHCGPRLSIVSAIPYDRANTSMAAFPMCDRCRQEYEDPADRRFHAQPNACAECGPQLWLEDAAGSRVAHTDGCDVIETAAQLLHQGMVVAIKGVGGIHLACDAGNELAVQTLRQRKHRYHKALAVMATDIAMVSRYARVSQIEADLLQHRAAPIVILDAAGESLAGGIAPGHNSLGFMLPYTPLHHLLLQEMQRPIVLTSGNRSDEPQSIDNLDARQRLDQIAGYYLLHDRDIVNRLDDSVVRVMDGEPRFLRRARGYAPESILLPQGFATGENILALGGELKNTFCLLKQGRATMSQHMGDLEDAVTYHDYQNTLRLYRRLFDFQPQLIAVDRHPDYLSTKLGYALAAEENISLVEVQHHHAHIAASMAEHGVPLDGGKVIGVALDGLGYGAGGSIWGGEFLLADYHGFERLAHFQPVPMLGGAQAMREPWRNTLAQLSTSLGWDWVITNHGDLDMVRFLEGKPLNTLSSMAEKGLNSPPTSSAGRLFDAVAAAVGVCRESAGYEGQAAIELEVLANGEFQGQKDRAYGFELRDGCLGWALMWRAILKDLGTGTEPAVIAARFHHTVASAVAHTAAELCERHEIDTLVLSGGVFQNRLLLEQTSRLLRNRGLQVLAPKRLPVNDGGLALGQAVIALASRI